MIGRIGQALKRQVRGEVLADEKTLARYATDMSIYEVHPLAVVVPRDPEDVAAVVRFAREEGIPLTLRGGGSSTTGSALGRGIILAFPRGGPMDRVLDFEEVDGEPQVTVEPAVRHDDLQHFLRERGLYLPSDPSSGAIYGHAGSGNLHLRPLFDVTTSDLPALLIRVADEVYGTVLRYDGTITAEHGMGRLRTPYLGQEWSEAILGYMRRVKEVFDPDDLLNPDVMFSARALTDDLRPIEYQ